MIKEEVKLEIKRLFSKCRLYGYEAFLLKIIAFLFLPKTTKKEICKKRIRDK